MEPLLTVNEIFSLSLSLCMCCFILCFLFFGLVFIMACLYYVQFTTLFKIENERKKTKNKSYFSHDLPTGFYDSCTLITYFRNVLAFFVSFVVSFCLLFLGFMFCVWICVNGTNIWKRAKSSAAHSESCIPHLPLTSLTVSTKMKRREKMKNKIL